MIKFINILSFAIFVFAYNTSGMDNYFSDHATLNDGLYTYHFPIKPPANEKDIINFGVRKRSEQIWKAPPWQDTKRMSLRQKIAYIERERQRWEEGVYVLINGELVYLTGMNYDHLTYMTFKSKRAEFFYHQIFDFYFRDLARRDEFCNGTLWLKPRRYGMTMEEITQATYTLIEDFENNIGLQSNTDEKTKTTLLTPIINSYSKRPKFMRGDFYAPNGKLLVSKLELKTNTIEPEGRPTKYLNGWLMGFPFLPQAMDGNEIAYGVMDEVWKVTHASPKETYDSNRLVTSGRNRKGGISVLSTMGDSDAYTRSVLEGFDMIAKSNPNERDENGFTLTGLYKRFVGAECSFDIPPGIFEIDIFGKINIQKHIEYIQRKVNAHSPDSKAYIFEKRRLPLTEADVLLSAANISYFSAMRIALRRQQLRELAAKKQPPWIRGNFKPGSNGNIYFEADPAGIWMVALHPYFSAEGNIDTRNRFSVYDGIFYPPSNPEFFGALDPIRYRKEDTSSNSLSKVCGIIHKKFDYFGSGVINRYAAMMLYRPDDPREGNKEMIKACKYYGAPTMYERNIPTPKEDFIDANCLPFLLKNPKDEIHGMYISSNGTIVQEGIDMLVSEFAPPQKEDEIDQIMQIPWDEMLLDMDNFDIKNTTAFDVFMTLIGLKHGEKQFHFTNVTQQNMANPLSFIDELIVPYEQSQKANINRRRVKM